MSGLQHNLQRVTCRGTPYKIGHQHGTAATEQIERSISFYSVLFSQYAGKSWPQVRETATKFQTNIGDKWPRYLEEMQGIADGSHRDLLDIIALNVRTEIAFGLFSDGCTSLSWRAGNRSFLGQNWDWMQEQKDNLLLLSIYQQGFPTIKMVTEAGIIGKIGMNSDGVGVCLNAIKAKGLDQMRLPVHLALRMALESVSVQHAISSLERNGIASSAHILVADASGVVGLECTSSRVERLSEDEQGRYYHSNHFLSKVLAGRECHNEEELEDSEFRADRIKELAEASNASPGALSFFNFRQFFCDHEHFPQSICRAQEGVSKDASLFNFSMDLAQRTAIVTLGRICHATEMVSVNFEE